MEFNMIFENIYLEYTARILFSIICGFCLGFERKIRRNVVGIRTLVLISVSSCLMCILSAYMAEIYPDKTDSSRIAAGVITGIGFLGGGAIFRQGLNIRGLTTAAIIWTAAALGLTCGAGLYIPVLITLVLCMVMLISMRTFEHKLFPAERTKSISLEFDSADIDEKEIKSILISFGLVVNDLNIENRYKAGTVELYYSVKTPDNVNSLGLSVKLSKLEHLVKFSISE